MTPWLKELVEHHTQVLGSDDARHSSERIAVLLCMQSTDISICRAVIAVAPGPHGSLIRAPSRRGRLTDAPYGPT